MILDALARRVEPGVQIGTEVLEDAGRGTFEGVGFNILNESGAPIGTFGYLDPIDAARARELIEKAIADAVPIIGWASEAQRSPYR